MTVYETDVDEIAARRDEALEVFIRNAAEALELAATTFQPTPDLNVKAVLALESLANYQRLRRAHRTAVQG